MRTSGRLASARQRGLTTGICVDYTLRSGRTDRGAVPVVRTFQMLARTRLAPALPWPLLLASAWLVACTPSTPSETPTATPATGEERAGSGETATPATTGEAGAALAGSAPPVLDPARPCTRDDECRTWQPGDWSADVECCYAYPCRLDFAAIHVQDWETRRAWQRANPFDCVAHLRETGPCDPRTPRCGLDQTAPAAVCRDGACALAAPDPWPQIDPQAQICTSNADCVALATSTLQPQARCCENRPCPGGWTAVSRETMRELQQWQEHDATCPEDASCSTTPISCAPGAVPAVVCTAGFCQVR